MKSIELECPSCKEMLELDTGFAGGVCRCFKCGTMMTVPAEPGRGAEAISRPDSPSRPDAPPGSSSIAGAQSTIHRPAAQSSANGAPGSGMKRLDRAAAPSPVKPASQKTASESAATTAGSGVAQAVQTYVTASGRIVQVAANLVIPTARKRKKALIRASTAVIFIGGLVFLVAFCIVAIVMLANAGSSKDGGTGPGSGKVASAGLPTPSDKAHFLGRKIEQSTIMVIDASSTSREWLDDVKLALRLGTDAAPPEAAMQVVFATDLGAQKYPAKLQPWSLQDRQKLAAYCDTITAMRVADLPTIIESLVADQPLRMVLVTGQNLNEEQIRRIDLAMNKAPNTVLDVVQIGLNNASLGKIAKRTGGDHFYPTAQNLQQWVQNMQAHSK